jgi:GNAT superfamily N-acetyltransferase
VIRRATADDVDAIADVLASARAEQAWMPPIYTAESDRRFVAAVLLPEHEVWVAEDDEAVVGFAALKGDLLGHLFVRPDAQGRGLGTALLDKAKERLPGGFTLWTHQPNEQARTFYERRGLLAIEFTDGATNMEQVPDVRYAWRPTRSRHAPAAPGSNER